MLTQNEYAVLKFIARIDPKGGHPDRVPLLDQQEALGLSLRAFISREVGLTPRQVQRFLARCRAEGWLKLNRSTPWSPWSVTAEGSAELLQADTNGVSADLKAGRPRGFLQQTRFTTIDRFILWALGTKNTFHVSSYADMCRCTREGLWSSVKKLSKIGWIRKKPSDPTRWGFIDAQLTYLGFDKFKEQFPGQTAKPYLDKEGSLVEP